MRIIHFFILVSLTQAIFAVDFTGRWTSQCQQVLDAFHYRVDLEYEENGRTSLVVKFFEDRNCRDAQFYNLRYFGGYQAYPTNEEFVDFIDYFWTQKLVTYFLDEQVQQANEDEECGYTDWEKFVPKDVLGRICYGELQESRHYSVVGVIRRRLYFGYYTDELDGSTPGKRPVELDRETPYFRY